MAITTYGDINQRTAVWAITEMLEHARPILVLNKWAQTTQVPKNKAQVVKFRRPVPFTVSTVPLVEGVTPTAAKISFVDVTAQLKQYGGLSSLTDVVQDVAEDPVLKTQMELMGELAAETLEMVCYGVLKAGTSVFYGATADTARTDVNDPVTGARQMAVTRSLKAQRAKKVTKVVGATVKISTQPVEASFGAFCHTDVEYDLRQITGFVTTVEYGTFQPASEYEIGKFQDCRYIQSPLLDPFQAGGSATLNSMIADDATNVDVYPIIYVARDAYGSVMLQGAHSIKPIVVNPDQISKSDPLGQRGFVGFKTWYCAVRLNEAWMARLEVGATDL